MPARSGLRRRHFRLPSVVGGEILEFEVQIRRGLKPAVFVLAEAAEHRPFDLALCGHTHGGQVALPSGRPIIVPSGGLNRRYVHGRFDVGPTVCVTDRRFPWAIDGEGGWAPEQDLARHLQALSARHPGRVRRVGEVGPFVLWETEMPLDDVLAAEPGFATSGGALATRVGREAGRP